MTGMSGLRAEGKWDTKVGGVVEGKISYFNNRQSGYVLATQADRGYRAVGPSPLPLGGIPPSGVRVAQFPRVRHGLAWRATQPAGRHPAQRAGTCLHRRGLLACHPREWPAHGWCLWSGESQHSRLTAGVSPLDSQTPRQSRTISSPQCWQ